MANFSKTLFKSTSSVFGDTAQYTSIDGVVSHIRGTLTKQPVELGEDGRGILVSSVRTSFGVLLEDLKTQPREGDTIIIRGIKYRVSEIQEGSSGCTAKLILMKAMKEDDA